ncbi:MAG: VIT1/CCC1 transporter family protein [Nanoarchaeota archaeon]
MKKEVSLTVKQGNLLREFIFGLNDGLVSTLSLLAGLTGALISNNIIILGGLAEIVAGSISMGLGAYISTKSEEEYYKSKIEKERKSIEDIPNIEIKELKDLYRKKGFNQKEINLIVSKITKHKATWLDILIHEKIGIGENFEDPKIMGLTNGLSFIIGGLFPILPFFVSQFQNPLLIGTIFALIVLFIIGALKSKTTGKNWLTSGLELSFICLLAASLSYLAGKLIINL